MFHCQRSPKLPITLIELIRRGLVECAVLIEVLDIAQEVAGETDARICTAQHLTNPLRGVFRACSSIQLGEGAVEFDSGQVLHAAECTRALGERSSQSGDVRDTRGALARSSTQRIVGMVEHARMFRS